MGPQPDSQRSDYAGDDVAGESSWLEINRSGIRMPLAGDRIAATLSNAAMVTRRSVNREDAEI